MSSNRLQLNATKTRFFGAHHLVDNISCPQISSPSVTTKSYHSRPVAIYMDTDLSMQTHVLWTASGCFAVLRRIESIRRSVTQSVLQSLVVALSRLNYGRTVHSGLPQQLVDKLQSVQNTMTWLIFATRHRDHISPLLQGLHWWQVSWSYYISVGGTHLPLPSQFSTRVPDDTTAASLWCWLTSSTSLFVFHCAG